MKLPKLKYVYEQQWLVERCVGKRVLHLGCAGDATLRGGINASLHAQVHKVAKSLSGVELSESSLTELKTFLPEDMTNKYFTGDVQDLESCGVVGRFDVILAGSIIEHLSNAGSMIRSARSFLEKGGIMLISTPHTWGVLEFLRVAMKKVEAVHPEHTCWYSIPTLSHLMARYGFVPVEWATGYGWQQETVRWKLQKSIGIPVFKLLPHLGGSLLAAFRVEE